MACQFGEILTYLDSNHVDSNFPKELNHDFIIVRHLGKGSYGEVWLSKNKKTNRKNAIKCLTRESRKFTESQKKRLVDKLNKELDLLRMLDHPDVVNFLEANICKPNSIYLTLELMSRGNLREFLIDGGQLEESTITDFGLPKLVNDDTICKTYCGTPLYLAPEVVLSVLRR
ncbi:hypothetical protein DAPPUDRAFT_333140 [Daphnia pulex]|uniref:non-specific serine/threonine protein kinase n=1 Tax=Daphnia pulex TaxID=6669 RepID=E9HRZ7_DAPPU|nr:hypothetical protein DAPPUDRAFT_333140 [Daphnia pulex]|eukprot:EFX65490.1 hypothetical protein DAPPUDRAFT_333140 [Daphnia pulex]